MERHASWIVEGGKSEGGGGGIKTAKGLRERARGAGWQREEGMVAAIKYNFRGVGLIPRIPRKYFIYYLHFVVDT